MSNNCIHRCLLLVLVVFTGPLLLAQEEKIDLAVIEKIKDEGLNRSKVMDIAFYLTDVNGPRLQGSPGYVKAANWSKNKLTSWGVANARLEPWGEWGRGWELKKSYLAMSVPYYKPVIAFPKSWCAGTNGPQHAGVSLVDAKDSVELSTYRGKLRGKILMLTGDVMYQQTFVSDASRMTDEFLHRMEAYQPDSTNTVNRQPANAPAPNGNGSISLAAFKDFAKAEGAVAVLTTTSHGHDGTLFVSGGGSYAASAPENLLDLVLAVEDYNTIYRLVKSSIPVELDVEVQTVFNNKDTKGYNVIAEIAGTDPKLKQELVMVGGHLDSWHSAMGATDNAAGCAVMLEAMRILKVTGIRPRRTIRIALWGGEETGLHGSRNYVKNHFADTLKRMPNPEGDKLSVYFNLDNGTGKIRGVYLQGNKPVKPVFAKWLEPFKDMGASTLSLQNTGGTDHLSFDAIGLPAFQFIQDGIEYGTRTHHTNMDTYDHLIADDLKQAAVIIASFVYNASQRDEKIPRKTPVSLPTVSK